MPTTSWLVWAALLASLCCAAGCKRFKTDDEKRAEATVDACIDEGKDLEACGTAGEPAMWLAASAGAPDAVRKLVAQGAEVDAVWKDTSPLFEASKRQSKGYVEVVKVLLEAGADPDKQLAPEFDWQSGPRTPFFKAAGNPNPQVLRLMLAHAPDFETRSNVGAYLAGATALHHATLMGLHENVRLLLEAGMDRDAPEKDGHTAAELVDKVPESFKQGTLARVKLADDVPSGAVDYEKTRALLTD